MCTSSTTKYQRKCTLSTKSHAYVKALVGKAKALRHAIPFDEKVRSGRSPARSRPPCRADRRRDNRQGREGGAGGSLTLGGETAEEPEVSEEERVTTSQIIILRTEHNKQNDSLKKSSKELKKTRTELGVYLYYLKNLLAKTGRNGRWTSFLLLMQLNDESPYSEIEAPDVRSLARSLYQA
jgi:hypothetical protein